MAFEGLKKKGIRLSLDAEEFISRNSLPEEEIIALKKHFVNLEDVQGIVSRKKEEHKKPEAEASAPSSPRPLASEYEPELRVREDSDVTGKSRTEGGVEDFVSYFRNRYESLSALLKTYSGKYPEADLEGISKLAGQKARIIVMVTEFRETKKGNMLLQVEDLTGQFKVVVSRRDEKVFEKAMNLVKDDVILIYGKIAPAFMIAEDLEWPDVRVGRDKKEAERDLAAVYLSDLHFGSKEFLGEYFNRFLDWINLRGSGQELAGNLKYVFVADL